MCLLTAQEMGRDEAELGWGLNSPPSIAVYSIPPGGKSLPFADLKAIAANEVMAHALETIDRSLARRLRACRHGSRCRARKYCSICSPIQAEQFGRKFEPKLLKLPNASHLTLTTRSCVYLTRKEVEATVKAFARLKEREKFKQLGR